MVEGTPKPILVFDADNTIFLRPDGTGSEEVKDGAWNEVFPECTPDDLERLLEITKEEIKGGKGDRRDFARRVCQYIGVHEDQVEQQVKERCQAFDEVVQQGILEVGVTPENRDALEKLSEQATIYINTATPEEPVRQSLQALGLLAVAIGVLGRPGNKVTNLQKIMELEGVGPDKITFVGDSEGDYEAAQNLGCNFVGVWTKRNTKWHDPAQAPSRMIHSLSELVK